MNCLDIIVGYKCNIICPNSASDNGFCVMHRKNICYIDNLLRIYGTEPYQKFFKDNNLDTFDRCLELPSIKSEYLNQLLITLMDSENNDSGPIISVMTHPEFFPDLDDYSIFVNQHSNYELDHIQAGFSAYFHKRWSIKLALQSINNELEDCINLITDPYQNKINKPYYYTKFLLHRVLYPKIDFDNGRTVKIISDDDHIIDVTEDDNGALMFNKIYLINNRHYYAYVVKIIEDQLFDLNDDDIKFLQQNNKGIMRVIDNSEDDDRFAGSEFRESPSNVINVNMEGLIAK